MASDYDAIIIGGGIGGLICGCYLAKAGKKILVLESHDKLGGCVTSIKRQNATFDVGAHLIGSGGDRGLFAKYLRDLGIDIELIRLNPTDRFHFPNRKIDIPQNVTDFLDMLKKMFVSETDNIETFFKEMFRIAVNFDNERILDIYQDLSYQDMLDKFFKNEELKGILSAQYHYIGVTPEKASALSMCLMITSYIKDGCYLVKGGAQNLSDKLGSRIKEFKGEVVLNTKVEKIEIMSQTATTVITEKNKKYTARQVVSNIDPRKAFFDLIDKSCLPSDYIEKIMRLTVGSSFFLTFLIVDLETSALKSCSGWHYSSYRLNDVDTQSFYIFVPTIYDQSLNADGLHNVELAMQFPFIYGEIKNWGGVKLQLEEELINKAGSAIRDLRKHIKYKFSATPHTIERFTGNSKGSLYGWEMSVGQVQRYRLDNETPIKNLFLVGHWTKPGCGVVSVATSGWKVAKKILQKENHDI